ncbi:MAG TPA: PPC domain-containing protein [Allocoleopsis sp.]
MDNPISETLPPGTYFIEVRTLSSTTSSYALTLATTAKPSNIPTDPGSNLETAHNLGILPASFTAKELVGEQDQTDYYKFTLNQISDFNATLSRLSESVNLTLILDANGNNFLDGNETLTSSYSSITSNSPISKTLPAGTYFLKASSSSANNTSYDLTFSTVAKPSSLISDPGSSLGTAYDLGILAGTLVAKDLVGTLDKMDYYKFSLNKSSSFNATLSGLSDTVSITLIADANGNGLIDGGEEFASGSGSTSFNSPISRTLSPGTYFIRASSSSSFNNTAYTLTLAG